MKTFLARLLGIAGGLLNFLLPLLRSEAGKFLADPRVQKLAVIACQVAATRAADGDGKHEIAVAELEKGVRDLGTEYARAWLGAVVAAAYQKWQAGGSAAGND